MKNTMKIFLNKYVELEKDEQKIKNSSLIARHKNLILLI